MPTSFDFEAGFPSVLTSKCIAYDGVTTWTTVIVYPTLTGTIYFHIGTSSSINGSIVWQEVSSNTEVTLTNPNKALFYRCAGESGAILTDLKIKCG